MKREPKRRRRRRKPAVKDVQCSVGLIVGGRTVKSVRRRITLRQAVKEIRGDPLCTEGRLLTGVPLSRRRSIVRGVTVAIMWAADPSPVPAPCGFRLGIADAKAVIAAGIPM